jgi:hypothetical protein
VLSICILCVCGTDGGWRTAALHAIAVDDGQPDLQSADGCEERFLAASVSMVAQMHAVSSLQRTSVHVHTAKRLEVDDRRREGKLGES